MKNLKLVCTNCGKEYSIDKLKARCDECNEPLEVEEIMAGKIKNGNILTQSIFDRYQDFMPFDGFDISMTLSEGFTPLVKSNRLADKLDIKNAYFKNETQNPTWSFKDRGTSACIIHAAKIGYKRIGTVSTGNMAPSVAAYGRKNGLQTYVLVNSNIPDEKLNPIAIYSPHLIKVDGDYGNLYYKSLEIGEKNDIYFMNSDVPFRVEGSKIIAFEICEQLDFEMPDYIVVPTSAGGNVRGIEKGFREFENAGLIKRIPKIIVAQAMGCSPIVKAFDDGREVIERFSNPDTIAHAIENPYPPSGNQVLRMLKRNKGSAIAVNEEEIINAQRLQAEEGIFGQPASAVALAALIKLRGQDKIKENDSVVCIVTGSGLKYTAVFEKHDLEVSDCKMENLSTMLTKEKS
ncbi:MAG: threonine synthase, partial [Bacillota bacterium]|nr:threonine synthase [Bacillota bacterium]